MNQDRINSKLRFVIGQAQDDLDNGRLADAESKYRWALKWLPCDSQLHLTLGLLYLAQGLFESAIAEIGQAVQLNPENANARRALDHAIEAAGQTTGEKPPGLRKRLMPPMESRPAPWPHRNLWRQNDREKSAGKKIRKVLFVSPIYGGSLEVVRYLSAGFEQAGKTTLLLDNSTVYPYYQKIIEGPADEREKESLIHRMLVELDERLLDRAAQFKPDLIMAIAQSPLENQTVQKLRAGGITCAYWFVEDYRFREYWAEIAPAYDFFFMIQRDVRLQSQFKHMGYANWHYLPLACEPSVHKPWTAVADLRRPYDCQIGFMGAPYLNRLKIFNKLTQYELKIWGEGWSDCELTPALESCVQEGRKRTSPEDSARIYASAQIIVNLHSSPFVEDISAEGDFINPRTFEVAGCGGFQLTDYRCELPPLFVPGKEIILFHDLEELHALIKYWLPRDQMRAAISQKAQARAYAEHTYRHRAEQIIEIIENARP